MPCQQEGGYISIPDKGSLHPYLIIISTLQDRSAALGWVRRVPRGAAGPRGQRTACGRQGHSTYARSY